MDRRLGLSHRCCPAAWRAGQKDEGGLRTEGRAEDDDKGLGGRRQDAGLRSATTARSRAAGRGGRAGRRPPGEHQDPEGGPENPPENLVLEDRPTSPPARADAAAPMCPLSQDLLSIPGDLPVQVLLSLEFSSLADLHLRDRPFQDLHREQGLLGCGGS